MWRIFCSLQLCYYICSLLHSFLHGKLENNWFSCLLLQQCCYWQKNFVFAITLTRWTITNFMEIKWPFLPRFHYIYLKTLKYNKSGQLFYCKCNIYYNNITRTIWIFVKEYVITFPPRHDIIGAFIGHTIVTCTDYSIFLIHNTSTNLLK